MNEVLHNCKPETPMRKNELQKSDDAQFKEMGQQLEIQYQRVTVATRDIAIFGAMIETVQKVVSTAGTTPTRGPQTKGDGVKGWLEKYAPSVNRATAYRYLDIAKGIREKFHLGHSIDLADLLRSPIDKLPLAQRKKRGAIDAAIEGKSQRQLLLNFGGIGVPDPKRRGGTQERKKAPLSPEEKIKQEHDSALETWAFHEQTVLAYAFGSDAVKPNWEPLTVLELSQLARSFRNVAQLFEKTVEARKGKS